MMFALALAIPIADAFPSETLPPCGTPAHAETIRTAPRPLVRTMAPPYSTERDACTECVYTNVQNSEHFVLKWGGEVSLDYSMTSELLELMEEAWEVQLGVMGLTAPEGTDEYAFNIYIGNSGDGTPSISGASGYYTRDSEGWPIIVMHPDSLLNSDWLEVVSAHEFFHAVQDASGSYSYSGDGAWYWEATANWAAGEVHPDNPTYSTHLGGYAMLPDLALESFDYPDTGTLRELHHYGAFIFPRYLSEVVADWTLIRDSWLFGHETEVPIEALRELLAERGVDFADAFGEFTARNVTWDYVDGAFYDETVEYAAVAYADDARPIAGSIGTSGTEGWVDAPSDDLPRDHGYHLLQISVVPGTYTVSFDGDPTGDEGSDADWRVTVVLEDYSESEYLPMALDDDLAGELDFEAGGLRNAWIVVAATPAQADSGEEFDYRYSVSFDPETSGEGWTPNIQIGSGSSETVGGCRHVGGSGLLWLVGLLASTLRRSMRGST